MLLREMCMCKSQYNTNIRTKSQEINTELVGKKMEDLGNEYLRRANKNKEKNYSLKQAFLNWKALIEII